MNKITEEQFIGEIKSIFMVSDNMTSSTDMSEYVKDSIDLGELIAVIKDKYQVEPTNRELFLKYKSLGDVLKIFNNEINS